MVSWKSAGNGTLEGIPSVSDLNASKLIITHAKSLKPVPAPESQVFGSKIRTHIFADVPTRQDYLAKCTAILLAALDEIAWLHYLRGSDIDFNPVFVAYAVVTKDITTLFVQYGAPVDIDVKSYKGFWTFLKEFKSDSRVLVTDKSRLAVAETVGTVRHFWGPMRCYKHPGIIPSQDLFKGLNFPRSRQLVPMLPSYTTLRMRRIPPLLTRRRSTTQFFDGTTDVTRTWHHGTPKPEQIRANTRGLQGHIAIDTAVFPNGATGYTIDSWTRRALWEDRLDYRHGTGDEVGHFRVLNVHEGPHGIGTHKFKRESAQADTTVSNEPGYRADSKFGIRIENIVLVRLSQRGLANVSPLLQDDKSALGWLKRECSPI
ncbi:peptidase M24, structural domain-containing protein [Armillaria fumosa]|nr:peptidase M24, structural domain-containing protein [Armillaria fumosa]